MNVIDSEAGNRKGIPQFGGGRKETVSTVDTYMPI